MAELAQMWFPPPTLVETVRLDVAEPGQTRPQPLQDTAGNHQARAPERSQIALKAERSDTQHAAIDRGSQLAVQTARKPTKTL